MYSASTFHLILFPVAFEGGLSAGGWTQFHAVHLLYLTISRTGSLLPALTVTEVGDRNAACTHTTHTEFIQQQPDFIDVCPRPPLIGASNFPLLHM